MKKTTNHVKNYFFSLIFLFFSCFGFTQITQRGTSTTAVTTNTTLTIAKPSGIVTGDIMLVNIAQLGNNSTAPSLSGWTLINGASLGSSVQYGAVLYRVAGAYEGSNYTFTLGTGVSSAVGSIVAFSGVDTTSPFDVTPGTIYVKTSSTNVTATTITTTTANAAIIMFGQAANSAPTWSSWKTTSPATLTELYDNQSTYASVGAAWATKATAGTTGSGAATLSTAEQNGGFLVALRQGPEINIQGNTITIVDGDTTPSINDKTDFGSVDFNSGIVIKTYTIQNTGASSLTIDAISITGTNASDFIVSKTPSTSIISGGSTTVSITFDPSSLGLKTATLSIINNDSNENPYDFAIQGIGAQTFFDSDGDGIYDNVDIDDDNDGILDLTEENNCNNANGHKVNYKFLNETFGTGARTTINTTYDATTTYCYEDGIVGTNTTECPFESSKILDDGEYCVVSTITVPGSLASNPANIHGNLAWYDGEDHTVGDTNGRMAVFNASFTPGIFYETTINGILSNLPITYSFWALNIMAQSTFSGSILPNITVQFVDLSNNILATYNTGDFGRCSGGTTDNTCAQGVWKQFTTSVNLGNVNAFTVRFINNAPGGGGNDLALDDIVITQTLCDLDNDGVADMFDLDSDNDGIPDVVEAGLGNLSNGKGKIDITWVDANKNGLHDDAEATAALPALDSDGDGSPNYIDLDSDNDSLFDVDESGAGNSSVLAPAGYVNGDGDINGDGTGDGPESETFRNKDTDGNGVDAVGFGDGILDIYDYGNKNLSATFANQYGNLTQGIANANPATTYLKDTDGDGIPDYLDVKSNGITFDIANTLLIYDYKNLDANNDGIIDGNTDIDKDGILDAFDTNTAYFGSPRDLHTKLFLEFDGRNDYGQSTALLGGLANASLMAWIDLNPAFSTDGVVVGQDNFQLRITSAKKLEAVVNGTTVTFGTALNLSQWYNIGATYDGINIKLYLNGALVATQAKSGSISADASFLTLGKDPSTNTKYFKGKMDEVRVFNVALTDSQLQRMVYQEIQNNSSQIRGAIVPKNIATTPDSLPFANLLRYYRMDNYKDDVIDDLTTPAIDIIGTRIYNNKNIYVQQAPMPFLTERTGTFSTAVNSPSKEIRGNDVMEQDWSIIKVQHDITETVNNIDLGMLVDAGKNIVMNDDKKIQNDWYLKLDGKIDLVGMSQLVQTNESDLDVTSSGSIERDQKGQSNLYNYNYWSSPVSPVNSLVNNKDYTVNGNMKDGTTTTPQNINWVGGYNGAPTTPISIARYWLYKFDNYGNNYYNWSQITETDPLRVGLGFTMKGSGSNGTTQNYTFVGKPNNGTITNTVGDNQILLTGNPYPSALDANAFINDNPSSIDGTIYFWEHYTTNDTHVLRDYQGGYAIRNLTGGVAPSSSGVDYISQLGSPSRGIPGQYIPVGQGFFVNGKIGSGGTVTINNAQRGFHKEDELEVSNVMYKNASSLKTQKRTANNDNDPIAKDTIMKIRLGFISHNNYHKQVLLGFLNEKATSGMDYGYDGLNFDDLPNDMYLLNGENQLAIEGEGFFDPEASYSIGVKTDSEGKVKFMIDALENFNSEPALFIYDNLTDTYHNINTEAYEVNLPAGENNTRFSLRFIDKKLSLAEKSINDSTIIVKHIQNGNILLINNNLLDTTIKKVTLFNINGQSIANWMIKDQNQQNIQLPIKKTSSGIYIVKVQTSNGQISRKITIP